MNDSNYRRYSDLTLDELEQVVNDLENMSIVALKQKKKQLRITILRSVQEAKKEIERRLKK
tara:strand:- start:137 stop:319 length:183 start_codon:yes stop_codon:yes gene_type:complete